MTSSVKSSESASLKVPAKYLEDVRSAAIAEVADDSDTLRRANVEDRGASEVILSRSTRLLNPLLNAAGDVELIAESDRTSSPLVLICSKP